MTVLTRILKQLRPHYPALAIGMTCLLVSTSSMLAQPVLWKYMVDDVLLKSQHQYFAPILGIMLGAGMLGSLASGLRTWLLERTAQKFVLDLRKLIYSHLQSQPLAFFHERRSGDLIARVVGDVDTLQEVVINGTDTFLSNILGMIGVSGVLIWMNWKLGLATVLPVLITLSLMRRYNSKVKPVYRAARDKLGDVSAKLQENLTGINTVKAFAREEEAAARFHVTVLGFFTQSLLGISLRARYMPLVQFLTFLGSVIMIGFGGWLYMKNEIAIGTLVAYRGFWWQLYGPVYSIAGINDMLQRANAAGLRIFELLDHVPELRDAPDASELPRIRGEVCFTHVNFEYAAHSSAKGKTPG
ncbi:MAG: ABC transporter transmembrane domain-containing protein, partial [Planctomycetota bacterium]